MAYRVEFVPSALREMRKLSPDIGRRIGHAIGRLAYNPRPSAARRLAGDRSGYRTRVGDYRVLYEVDDEEQLITVGRVAHRGKAYR
jgi:mRNA interferase RelE/StbE